MPTSPWIQVLTVIGDEVARMWWFFLLSILLVGIIKGYRLDLRIRDSLNRVGHLGIFLAVLVGMVSPLCACGILPVVISLAMMGTPLPPLLALLVTSPVMGPDALLITYRGLGMEWAVLKLVGAAILGLSAGWAALFLERRSYFSGDPIRFRPVYRDDGTLASAAEIGAAHGVKVATMNITPRASKLRFIADRTWDAGLFIGKYLLLAIVLEALLVTFVPLSWITILVGEKSFFSVLMAALIGVPLPTNQIPMVPILAGLLQRGIDPGAALALLLAGPVTSIPALIALWGLFKRRVMFFYLVLTLGCSLLLGWGWQLVS